MTVQLELWHLISLLLAFFGASGAGLKIILGLIDRRFDGQEKARVSAGEEWARQFAALREEARNESGQWQRIERELLSFKADLPVQYVRREDYVRNQTIIEAKLDQLRLSIENQYLKGLKND